jgi:hypothetical protein
MVHPAKYPGPSFPTRHRFVLNTSGFRYPYELAWQVSAPKRVVRKSEPFKRFQRFLVGETEVVSEETDYCSPLTGC